MRRATTANVRAKNLRVSNAKQRKRQHLLDVKVRSHKATSHRNRRILVLLSRLFLAVGLAVGLFFGARFGARRLFFENPNYQLSQIEIRTDGMLQREQILKTAELQEGENIFTINLARVQERLQQLPQVDEVQVVRKMPAEIDITIVERRPIAWITSDKEVTDPFASDVAFLVDARGVLMKEKKLLPEYLGLPLITGCANETLAAGKVIESYEAKAALELLRLSTRSFMQTRFQIREIDLSKGYCLIVSDKNHSRVTFGFDDLERQVQRLEQFLVYCDDAGKDLDTLNLLVQRNVPVTFGRSSVDTINDTFDPEGDEHRIMKAIPVATGRSASANASATKSNANSAPLQVRKAIPVHHGRKD